MSILFSNDVCTKPGIAVPPTCPRGGGYGSSGGANSSSQVSPAAHFGPFRPGTARFWGEFRRTRGRLALISGTGTGAGSARQNLSPFSIQDKSWEHCSPKFAGSRPNLVLISEKNGEPAASSRTQPYPEI